MSQNKGLLALLITVATFAITAPAAAQQTANLWVDTSGGSCTRNSSPAPYNDATACSSISAAYSAAAAGDTIYVKAGTYASQTVPSRSLGTTYVTISATPGETVNVDGISISSNYVTVNGFNGSGTIWVNAAGSGGVCSRHHVTVSNNKLSGTGAGIGGGCDNISIIGNEVSGTNTCSGGPEDSMQIIGYGNWGTYIPSNILIKNNYVHDMATAFGQCSAHADGIQFAGCINCTIEGNRFDKTDTSHIIMYAPVTGQPQVRNILVQNNSFGSVKEPGHGVSIGGESCTDANNVILQNNTFYSANTSDINCSSGGVAGTSRNNIFAANDGGFACGGSSNLSFSSNVFASGGCGSVKKVCTPSFVDPSHAAGDVRLNSADTCAKDYVASGGGTYPNFDMFGAVRPQGSGVDAGAFEINSSTAAANPPTGLTALAR